MGDQERTVEKECTGTKRYNLLLFLSINSGRSLHRLLYCRSVGLMRRLLTQQFLKIISTMRETAHRLMQSLDIAPPGSFAHTQVVPGTCTVPITVPVPVPLYTTSPSTGYSCTTST